MNSLIAKEIRLLLPAFALALLLSIVPAWVLTTPDKGGEFLTFTFPLLCFGGLMLTLTSFGREFGMGTFPLLLALPLSRARIWWVKIILLSGALALIFGGYFFCTTLRGSVDGDHSNSLAGTGGLA